MFAQILFTQWRWTRTMVVGLALVNLLLPAAVWSIFAGEISGPLAIPFIRGFEAVGPFAIFVACLGGFLLAAYPWTIDGATKHVYPLSLPIPWSRYVAHRFTAGALLLIVPAVTLLVGSLFALTLVELPSVLRAYPVSFFVRYLFASLLAYSVVFALQYLGGRRAPAILLGVLVATLLVPVTLQLLGFSEVNAAIARLLFEWPGPFAIFASEWKFVDV